jgi:two-component system cell cycle response regulator
MHSDRVLIAEDDRVAARVLERLLRQAGYEVRVAHDGKQAWAMYQQSPVPLVITDWMMPEMDGLELCHHLREHSYDGYTYILLLTARDQKEDRVAALNAGADDFLTKPPDPAELHARLRTAQRILDTEGRLRQQNRQLQELNEELHMQAEQLANSMQLIEFANRRFAELFENLPIPCFTFDAQGILHEWNRAAEQLYGYPKTEVLFRPMFETVFRDDATTRMQSLMQQVLSGSTLLGIESEDYDTEGRLRYVVRNAFPLRSPTGEVVGGIVAVVDVTDRVEYERHLQNLALTDGLTGIPNHRAFQEFLEQKFTEARRYGQPLSLILVDVDHFKQFNDTFGHQAGDEVLRRVAAILRSKARRADFVARYGGEEFVLVLPSTDEQSGVQVAERLREAIAEAEWQHRPVTASFGVAMLQEEMTCRQQLIEAADRALYHAKATGRNRVCRASALTETPNCEANEGESKGRISPSKQENRHEERIVATKRVSRAA